MKSRSDILKHIVDILHQHKISVYAVSKITGINRSTLQKAVTGSRYLNLRQFKTLLDALPLAPHERKDLFDNYLQFTWSNEQQLCNSYVVDIINSISDFLNNNDNSDLNIEYKPYNLLKNMYRGEDAQIFIKSLMQSKLSECKNKELSIFIYMPFYNNFMFEHIGKYIKNSKNKINVSILFEFIKTQGYDVGKNLLTLKNILPLALDEDDHYQLNYYYVDSYFYDNHVTTFPYYIAIDNHLILLNSSLDNIVVIKDKDIIDLVIKNHIDNIEKSKKLTTALVGVEDCVKNLMNNQVSSDDIYAISYLPGISSFVPPNMYKDLIPDNLPDKDYLLHLIENRITHIENVATKYLLFNCESIDYFVETGSILPIECTTLKKCNLEQRKIILQNIYDSLDNKKVIMRGFYPNEINLSKKFEITSMQSYYNLSILIYNDNYTVKLVNINEPIISKYFINFFNDIIDTQMTLSFDETKELFEDAIAKVNSMLNK